MYSNPSVLPVANSLNFGNKSNPKFRGGEVSVFW